MSGSGDRLPRLLALVPYLLARPGVRVAEAAADFGVPEPQLRRDLQLLWMCGLPGHGPGDLIDLSFEGDTITVGFDAGMARPLRLTGDEALALVVALRTLAEQPRLTDRGAVERALAKVEAAAGGAAEVASAVAVPVEPRDRVLAQVRGALDQGRGAAPDVLRAGPGRDHRARRRPDAAALVDGRCYLEAWCRPAGRVRLFRIDRVDAVDGAGRAVAAAGRRWPRATCPAGSTSRRRSTRWSPSGSAGRAAGSPSTTRASRSTELPDGRLEVTLRAADPTWVRRLVLGLGEAAQVVGPAWFAEQVRAEAAEALAAYARLDPG